MFISDKVGPKLDKITTGGNVLTGQKTISVTSTAVQITNNSQEIKNGVIIQALASNTNTVYVGGSSVDSTNGFELQAGQATSLAVNALNLIYINGTAGDGVCFITTY